MRIYSQILFDHRKQFTVQQYEKIMSDKTFVLSTEHFHMKQMTIAKVNR